MTNYQIASGDSVASLPPATTTTSTSNGMHDITLMVNGTSYPIATNQYSSHQNYVVQGHYSFFYDILNDYLKIYEKFHFVENIQIDWIKGFCFWSGEFKAWFENCRETVFGQHVSGGKWRFAFCDEQDAEDFRAKCAQKRQHTFDLPMPRHMFPNTSIFCTKIEEWALENLVGEYQFTVKNDSVVEAQVKSESEAVMTKLVWVDGNKEKDLP